MKISEQWLREWVSPRLDVRQLAERLTMAGLEVGGVDVAGAPLERVVVGRVRRATPHPSSDRLTVCDVEIGAKETVTVVCGAPNVAPGISVPVALPGAVLPHGLRIEGTRIEGIESNGMLCSAAELGLEAQSEGLLLLEPGARAGTPIAELLRLDDAIIEIDLTPNRGDCLSIAGIAREVAAITGARLTPPSVRAPRAKIKMTRRVRVKARADCPRYAGRVLRGIDPAARTPTWLAERLRRSGVRAIHPVVDVTNYVMLELGQPMHAFDLDRVHGDIQVRHAAPGDSLLLLDGTRLELGDSGALLIADADGPLALAGIMGGERSGMTGDTRNVFLESAYFRPEAIGSRSRTFNLQTDSSQRFERGVDPELQVKALERASQLLADITGGEFGPVTEVVSRRALPARPGIRLRHARVERLLGLAVPPRAIEDILHRLGMRTRRTKEGWLVTPPSYRFDLTIEADLVEEVARLYGYDRIPSVHPLAAMSAPACTETRIPRSRLRALLADRDYQEVISYSFVDPAWQEAVDPGASALELANPISADMAVMRTTLWPGLLRTVLHNRNRQQGRVRVFELGRRFRMVDGTVREEEVLAGVVTGTAWPEQWGTAAREVDFYDLKGDVEALLGVTGRTGEARFLPAEHPALHPGQSAAIQVGGEEIGRMGVLHPLVQDRLGLDQRAILFELDTAALMTARVPRFKEISRFPAIRRDLSITVPEEVSAQRVLDAVRESVGKLLVHLELFDEYRGEGIDSGRKSLSLGLTLQDSSRTLKDEEVDVLQARVVAALQAQLGARLRS